MGYKMKGAPMFDTSSKHGTNANYKKSGAPGLMDFAKKALDPLGLAKKARGLFGLGKKAGTPPVDPNAAAAAATTGAAVAPPAGVAPTDPTLAAAPVDPNATPMAAGAPMYGKKKGAPMYGKKKGAPKLKGNQHKIDKNKDGKISKADFNMMNK